MSSMPQMRENVENVAFWMEKMRLHAYDFDSEQMRPYLSIDRVLEGMFALAKEIFDVHVCFLKRAFDFQCFSRGAL